MLNTVEPVIINLSDYYKKISNKTTGYQVILNGEPVHCCIGSSKGIADFFGIDLNDLENVPPDSNALTIGYYCITIDGPGFDPKLDAVNTLLDLSYREWLGRTLKNPPKEMTNFDFGCRRISVQFIENSGYIVSYIKNGVLEKAYKVLGNLDPLIHFTPILLMFKKCINLTVDDLNEEIKISLYAPAEGEKDIIYWC